MIRSTLLLAFAGCAPVVTGGWGCNPSAIDDSGDSAIPCQTTIEQTWPEADSTYFYHRADLEFVLDDPDPEFTPTTILEGPDGAVTGESWLSEDEDTAYFTPATPLEPSTDYTATITTCMGDSSIDFTSSTLGEPLEVDIEGSTYLVNLFGGRVLEPDGVGEIITTFGTPMVLIEVRSAGDSLELMGAMAEDMGPEQDLCTPTFSFPEADFSQSPYFQVPEMDLAVEFGDISVVIHEFVLEGTFASDGSWFGGGIVGGELDARDVVDAIDEVDSPEDFCNLTASFGAPCVACASDGEEYCLDVLIDRLEGDRVDTDVVEITDPEDNPDCAT